MIKRSILKSALLAASAGILLSTAPILAEETATPSYEQFAVTAETSSYTVDYSQLEQFANAFGREEGGRMKIAYAAVEQQGQRFLTQYKRYLSNVPVEQLSRDDQLAYWLNTRNVLIMDAMADSRSRRRMQRGRGTPAEPGPVWTEKRITIDGVELSIHDIETNIILANFADNPNVIFGLYQGTSGGPAYRGEGFSGANINAELEEVGRDYINSSNGLRVRRSRAQVPAIYDWYGEAVFGDDDEAVRTHLAGLATGRNATRLAEATQFESRNFSYRSDELILRQQGPAGGGRGVGGGGSYGGGGGS